MSSSIPSESSKLAVVETLAAPVASAVVVQRRFLIPRWDSSAELAVCLVDDLSDAVLAVLEVAIPITDSASLSRRSPVPIKAVPSGL